MSALVDLGADALPRKAAPISLSAGMSARARRMSSSGEASGAGFSPLSVSFARTKASTGFALALITFSAGTFGSFTGWKAHH